MERAEPHIQFIAEGDTITPHFTLTKGGYFNGGSTG